MRARRILFALLPGLCALAFTRPSAADGASEQQSVLFFEAARRLIDAGDCAGAMPSLEESLRLNPSIGAHLSLAQCLVPDDPVSGWRHLKAAEGLARAKRDPRAAYAHEKAAALGPRLAFVRLTPLPDLRAATVSLDGVRVELDGDLVVASAGDHLLEVIAPAKKPWSQRVHTTLASTVDVRVNLEDAPVAAGGDTLARAPPPPPKTPPGDDERRIGVIVGAAGAGITVIGTVAGIVALSKKSDLERTCGSDFPNNCGGGSFSSAMRSSTSSELSATKGWATVSTICLVAGVATLAAGVVIYLIAPKTAAAPTPSASLSSATRRAVANALFGGEF